MTTEDLPRGVHDQEDATEEHSFDELARGLANGTVSRQQALKLLGGAVLGGVLASIPGMAWAHHKPGHRVPAGQAKQCYPDILCDGLCYNSNADPCNCGGCGIVCAPGQCCIAGGCVGSGSSCFCPPGSPPR